MQGAEESAAAHDTLQSLRRDVEAASKDKAALSSEHDSVKGMLEALRGERAELAEALEASEARLAAKEAQHAEQAERCSELQQWLAGRQLSRSWMSWRASWWQPPFSTRT